MGLRRSVFITGALSGILFGALAGTAAVAASPVPLAKTALFTKSVSGCHEAVLAHWTHPTLRVLEDHRVPLDKVLLCNGDIYQVFFVRFPYDPQDAGKTANYFLPIYEEMRIANDGHPVAFVAESFHTVVAVTFDGSRPIATAIEVYAPENPPGTKSAVRRP